MEQNDRVASVGVLWLSQLQAYHLYFVAVQMNFQYIFKIRLCLRIDCGYGWVIHSLPYTD